MIWIDSSAPLTQAQLRRNEYLRALPEVGLDFQNQLPLAYLDILEEIPLELVHDGTIRTFLNTIREYSRHLPYRQPFLWPGILDVNCIFSNKNQVPVRHKPRHRCLMIVIKFPLYRESMLGWTTLQISGFLPSLLLLIFLRMHVKTGQLCLNLGQFFRMFWPMHDES